MTKEEIFKKLEDYLIPYYKVVDLKTKEEEVKQGAFKGVTLVTEKVHNKNITKISGLEPFKFNFNNLVSTLQNMCGCSVTTHHVKEKSGEKTVEFLCIF